MSTDLREALLRAADATPPIRVPPGVFDRARGARGRRQLIAALASVLVVAALSVGIAVGNRPAELAPAGPSDSYVLPSSVVVPPAHTADVRDAPLIHALVVYHRENLPGASWSEDAEPVAIVGTDDQYRTYDRPDWGTPTHPGQSFLLSPDGRYLLMPAFPSNGVPRSWLLDVRNGSTRHIDAGAPLAWSPDGRQALLVKFGDGTSAAPQSPDLRLVDLPSGHIAWHVTLSARSNVDANLAAALSPDGSQVAVQEDDSYSIWTASGSATTFSIPGATLAGPAAWTPDGSGLVLQTNPGELEIHNARTGALIRKLPTVYPRPDLLSVVAWLGTTPVVVADRRALVLGEPVRMLVQAPQGTDELQIATVGALRTAAPGAPEPGPWFDRYRRMVPFGPGTKALLMLTLIAVVATVVIRRQRRRSRAHSLH